MLTDQVVKAIIEYLAQHNIPYHSSAWNKSKFNVICNHVLIQVELHDSVAFVRNYNPYNARYRIDLHCPESFNTIVRTVRHAASSYNRRTP